LVEDGDYVRNESDPDWPQFIDSMQLYKTFKDWCSQSRIGTIPRPTMFYAKMKAFGLDRQRMTSKPDSGYLGRENCGVRPYLMEVPPIVACIDVMNKNHGTRIDRGE